jgi:hypothetical protein
LRDCEIACVIVVGVRCRGAVLYDRNASRSARVSGVVGCDWFCCRQLEGRGRNSGQARHADSLSGEMASVARWHELIRNRVPAGSNDHDILPTGPRVLGSTCAASSGPFLVLVSTTYSIRVACHEINRCAKQVQCRVRITVPDCNPLARCSVSQYCATWRTSLVRSTTVEPPGGTATNGGQ